VTQSPSSSYPGSAKALDAVIIVAALGMIMLSSSLERANRLAGDALPLRNGGKLRLAGRQNVELYEARQLEALYEALSDTDDEVKRTETQREIDAFDAARRDRMFDDIAFAELHKRATLHTLLLLPYSFGVAGVLWLRFHICRLAPHLLLSLGTAIFAVLTGAMAWNLAMQLSTFSAVLMS